MSRRTFGLAALVSLVLAAAGCGGGGGGSPGGHVAQLGSTASSHESKALAFSRCMRSRGVPNWPDPTRYPQHPERPTFALQPLGIDPNSPQISTKIHDCEGLLHGTNPQHLG